MNNTESFCNRIMELRNTSVSEEDRSVVSRCILDYLGVWSAGKTSVKIGLKESEYEVLQRAFNNGFCSHLLELDDGHRGGMMHPGAPVLSAIVAAASYYDIWGTERIIKAVICGYEAAILLAEAVQPEHKLRGYHATGTCGTVGAAIGVAVLREYNETQLKSTLACAASSASGLLELIDDNSELKPYNVGRAAMDGLIAAMTGECMFTPPEDVIGGKRGFLQVMGENCRDVDWDDNIQTKKIEEIYVKPYASCRHCHSPIDATLQIRKDLKQEDINAIEKIVVETYSLAISGHDHTEIQSISSSKMSIPFSVATALVNGDAGLSEYTDDMIADETVIKITKKVEVIENAELTALCPQKRGAIVKIFLNNGQEFSKRVDYALGEPENPVSDEMLMRKTRSLLKYAGIAEAKADEMIRNVYRMSDLKNVFCMTRNV